MLGDDDDDASVHLNEKRPTNIGGGLKSCEYQERVHNDDDDDE